MGIGLILLVACVATLALVVVVRLAFPRGDSEQR